VIEDEEEEEEDVINAKRCEALGTLQLLKGSHGSSQIPDPVPCAITVDWVKEMTPERQDRHGFRIPRQR